MTTTSATLQAPLRRPRIDALPEYIEYVDRGCDLYPSCLRCPLPRCRYEDPGGAAAMLRNGRDASIIRLSEQDGVSVDELARMFGLSRRTVFRVLRAARGGCRR
ncbi:MAG TPA: helix-turn-helix domain-containing protein [Tepidiformaceae bacterium]|nr:helix-turn-helix domain-containing protein [Thermoflexaceae bacterium]HMS59498.1 helix-turn-helix domain-containing protein [Tepidiformaceae bacterium]